MQLFSLLSQVLSLYSSFSEYIHTKKEIWSTQKKVESELEKMENNMNFLIYKLEMLKAKNKKSEHDKIKQMLSYQKN